MQFLNSDNGSFLKFIYNCIGVFIDAVVGSPAPNTSENNLLYLIQFFATILFISAFFISLKIVGKYFNINSKSEFLYYFAVL